MKRLMVAGILTVGIFMMLKNTHSLFGDATRGNLALLMGGITQSELKQTIIEHYKDSILGDIGTITGDTIQTTVTDLNDDGKKDVIAILQSPQTCGTGGCIASIFVENDLGELTAIPFEYAVKDIEVLTSITHGMHDLRLNHDETHRMVWDGSMYVFEEI